MCFRLTGRIVAFFVFVCGGITNQYGAEMMESSMKSISRPVIDRLPVNQLDNFACRQLDKVSPPPPLFSLSLRRSPLALFRLPQPIVRPYGTGHLALLRWHRVPRARLLVRPNSPTHAQPNHEMTSDACPAAAAILSGSLPPSGLCGPWAF